MSIQFDLPREDETIIKVIGVGGGGSNAVNHMCEQGIVGVDFVICNTDEQALALSKVPIKVQLGPGLTDGRGAGSQPEVGRNATLESIDEIKRVLQDGTKMVFITAGMGGGTGTGGAPIVAKAAQELGILTVGIVTSPFSFEGRKRILQAQKGIQEMKENVDTLIVISNDKMRDLYGNLTLSNAFCNADDILATAARGIAEIITVPGYVNVDFEDVNTVMKSSGVAIMGTGVADGEDRAIKAVKAALASPLLDDNDITGAKHILLNITSGSREVLMDEVGTITNYIQEAAGYTSEVIWGNCSDPGLEDKLSVTVIATGFETNQDKRSHFQQQQRDRVILTLDDQPDPVRNRYSFEEKKTSFYQRPTNETRQERKPEINHNQVTNNTNRFRSNDYKRNDEIGNNRYSTNNINNEQQSYNRPQTTQQNKEEDRMKVFMERRKRLQGLSLKLKQENLEQMESEPAYKRRNIQLDDMPHSSESNVSQYSLFEEEKHKPEIKKRNPFLHDNVD